MSIQDMPDLLYAHGCLLERASVARQSQSHSPAPTPPPPQEPGATVAGSQHSGATGAHDAADSAGHLALFLAAAAKRFQGSKAAGTRFQATRMAALSAGLYGLALAAQVRGCVAEMAHSLTDMMIAWSSMNS